MITELLTSRVRRDRRPRLSWGKPSFKAYPTLFDGELFMFEKCTATNNYFGKGSTEPKHFGASLSSNRKISVVLGYFIPHLQVRNNSAEIFDLPFVQRMILQGRFGQVSVRKSKAAARGVQSDYPGMTYFSAFKCANALEQIANVLIVLKKTSRMAAEADHPSKVNNHVVKKKSPHCRKRNVKPRLLSLQVQQLCMPLVCRNCNCNQDSNSRTDGLCPARQVLIVSHPLERLTEHAGRVISQQLHILSPEFPGGIVA